MISYPVGAPVGKNAVVINTYTCPPPLPTPQPSLAQLWPMSLEIPRIRLVKHKSFLAQYCRFYSII